MPSVAQSVADRDLHEHLRELLCVTDMLVQRAHFFLQGGSAPVRKQKSPCEVARSPGSSRTPQPLEGCRRQVVSKEGCLKGGPGRRGISLWGEREILQSGLKHCHSLQISGQVWDFIS